MSTLVSIDPSSTRIGLAVFGEERMREYFLIRPARERDEANVRIRVMTADVVAVLDEVTPLRIIVEDTSGKVGRRHGGAGAGLAIHGKAVGYVVRACEAWAEAHVGASVHCVLENAWTRGVSKAERQRRVAAAYRCYEAAKDPGGDASDAIGLGIYWLTTQRLATALAGKASGR